MRRLPRPPMLAAALAALLCGCDASRLAGPARPPEHAAAVAQADALPSAPEGILHYYPLLLGSEWRYARVFRVVFRRLDGHPIGSPLTLGGTMVFRLEGTERRFGRDYVVERRTIFDDYIDRPIVQWVRYRQDRAGLYEADVPLDDPPERGAASASRLTWEGPHAAEVERGLRHLMERAARLHAILGTPWAWPGRAPAAARVPRPGVRPGEITRLSYPLERGRSWTVREESELLVTARVEKLEMRALPAGRLAGHRIRLASSLLGRGDQVRMWYGGEGFLELELHLEVQITDEGGGILGTLEVDESQRLTGVRLAGR